MCYIILISLNILRRVFVNKWTKRLKGKKLTQIKLILIDDQNILTVLI